MQDDYQRVIYEMEMRPCKFLLFYREEVFCKKGGGETRSILQVLRYGTSFIRKRNGDIDSALWGTRYS